MIQPAACAGLFYKKKGIRGLVPASRSWTPEDHFITPTNSFMRHILIIFILLSMIPYLQAQSEPMVTLEPYTFTNSAGEEVAAELGTLTVPVNRKKADGKTMQLKFVRFKSTNPKPGSPIVYLAGGPGGSGTGTAQGSRFGLFMQLRQIGDVIAFDQRGTGLSDGPPRYAEYWMYPIDEPLERDKVDAVVTEYTRQAVQFWREKGVDLTAYNTNESADDLNDLRRALGADKLSLWSISYGTHLALATMKRHGDHLDKVILAGVEGLDHTVKLPSDSQALLERIDALLKADPKTKDVYPDFLGDVQTLLDRLEQQPVLVATQHPATGAPMEIAIGKLDLQILLASRLRGPQTFARVPYSIQQMLAGDFSVLRRSAAYTHGGRVSAMSLAMDVASGISPQRRQHIQEEIPQTLLGDAINFPYFAHQAALPELDLGKDFRAPVVSDLPVLAISGTLDGRTPPGNAEEVLRTLPNGRHLIIDGAGHSDPLFLSDPEIAATMLAFLRGEPIEDRTIELAPVEWYVGE